MKLARAVCGKPQCRTKYEAAVDDDVYMLACPVCSQFNALAESEPVEVTDAMNRGHIYEPAILNDYDLITGHTTTWPQPVHWHPSSNIIYASPDGIREDGVPVEAKFSMSPRVAAKLGDEGTDWVPTDWLLQCQQQMDCVGAGETDVAVLLYGRLRIYRVERNEDLISGIHAAAEELYQRIKDRRPPPIAYQHPRAMDAVRRLHRTVTGESIELRGGDAEAARQYVELQEQIKRLTAQADEAKSQVLDSMGDCAIGTVPGMAVEFTRSIVPPTRVEAYDRRGYVRFGTRKAR